MGIFAKVSQIPIPTERAQVIFAETEVILGAETASEEHMSSKLTMKELDIAIHSLRQRKSLGPDCVTNDMLRRLGPVAKVVLLKLMNTSWQRGIVPQVWKEAKMVHIPKKKRKNKLHPNN
jgi:hypothetical protein